MHVPSVSDYKTNRGGEKKKREGKNCIVWKTAPYPIPSPYECKNRISPTSLFLNPNLLFRHHVHGETVLNESSTTNDLVQLGFNLNSSRQRAIRGKVVQRRRKKPDVARFPRVTESTTAPTRGGGAAVDISGCPCPGRVYTRPPTVSIDIDGATRNSDGCWRIHRLVVRGTRIVLVAAVKGGNGGCCRVSTCLASINQWEWHLGEAVGKGDGEEGDAWIERPSDCSTPGRIGGRRRGRGSENGSKTLLMNGVYDGPR